MITFPFLKKPRLARRQCLLSIVFKQGRSKSLCHFLEIRNVSATRKNPYHLKTSCYLYLENTLLCFLFLYKEQRETGSVPNKTGSHIGLKESIQRP